MEHPPHVGTSCPPGGNARGSRRWVAQGGIPPARRGPFLAGLLPVPGRHQHQPPASTACSSRSTRASRGSPATPRRTSGAGRAADLQLWVNPEDRRHLLERLRAGARSGTSPPEFRLKNGLTKPGSLSARLVADDDAECLLCYIRDLSETGHGRGRPAAVPRGRVHARERADRDLHRAERAADLRQPVAARVLRHPDVRPPPRPPERGRARRPGARRRADAQADAGRGRPAPLHGAAAAPGRHRGARGAHRQGHDLPRAAGDPGLDRRRLREDRGGKRPAAVRRGARGVQPAAAALQRHPQPRPPRPALGGLGAGGPARRARAGGVPGPLSVDPGRAPGGEGDPRRRARLPAAAGRAGARLENVDVAALLREVALLRAGGRPARHRDRAAAAAAAAGGGEPDPAPGVREPSLQRGQVRSRGRRR